MIRSALAAALIGMLAACASSPPRPADTLSAPAAPASSVSDAAPQPPPDQRQLMIDLAESMLGQPYRYGGAIPGGFDCSGLVAYSANGAGMRVPRTAREQLSAGHAIARGELRAGDLVFMHLAHKGLHVGIAIDAGHFIHAPATGGYVRIDSLAAPPYAKGFLGARRIIGQP